MSAQLTAVNATPKQVLLNFYEAEANYMKAHVDQPSALGVAFRSRKPDATNLC